jgi:hypothetical protein
MPSYLRHPLQSRVAVLSISCGTLGIMDDDLSQDFFVNESAPEERKNAAMLNPIEALHYE